MTLWEVWESFLYRINGNATMLIEKLVDDQIVTTLYKDVNDIVRYFFTLSANEMNIPVSYFNIAYADDCTKIEIGFQGVEKK